MIRFKLKMRIICVAVHVAWTSRLSSLDYSEPRSGAENCSRGRQPSVWGLDIFKVERRPNGRLRPVFPAPRRQYRGRQPVRGESSQFHVVSTAGVSPWSRFT